MKTLSLLLALSATAFAANDPFAELVRPTDPLTPEQERAAFHLPPGFEIQLVASEPDLRKPMNMNWDATGRLWITESREYPFAIKDGTPGRDTVRVFSDFGPDGKARKMEVFADGLNIPTGLYPFRSANADGKMTWKCIVWSIPSIWLMEDTDGDGKADKREILYGPLGWERDTHGNLSSYRRGDDGWLYGTHGFNNESTIRGRDGSSLHIQSGNTWRVRLDGSRVEGNTYGQVNPFGLCWDDRGNLYSADCHSSPIYQLLRGAYYPSFGKPHDGLGFAPQTILHSHGSTAICAPMYVHDKSWPAELQDHMFVGNVQTSRVNHDLIEWHGASSKGKELPDFVSTDDPWFRPVDLSWGPDGALYVADFYNKIIGHYEVPLLHPGRDRERGRLWRIVYRGALLNPAIAQDAAGLVKELASGNPTRRSLALNDLCDRIGKPAIELLKKAADAPANALQKTNALWALHRFNALDSTALIAATKDTDPLVRTHALRIAHEVTPWTPALADATRAALSDADAISARVATEALAAHPAPENIRPLLALLSRAPADDDHLLHSTRIALRDQLSAPGLGGNLSLDGLSQDDFRKLLDIMLAVPGEQNALLRFSIFEKTEVPADILAKQLPSLAKNLPADRLDSLISLARKRLTDLDAQAAIVQSAIDGFEQRKIAPDATLRDWGSEVATALLAAKAGSPGWAVTTSEGEIPWGFQERACADGKKAQVLSSIVHGEVRTGIMRSAPFPLPEKLSFYLCGHDGFPDKPAGKKNFVRLLDAADRKVLREAAPPRNDTAQKIEWDLAEFQGRTGIVEVTDGDDGEAYAWLAIGRFSPELPQLALNEPGSISLRKAQSADIARALKLTALAPQISAVFADTKSDPDARVAAARALIVIAPDQIPTLGKPLADDAEPIAFRELLAPALASSPAGRPAVADAFKGAPHRLQLAFAIALATSTDGAEALITACTDGRAAMTLLRERPVANRLAALKIAALDERVKKLTANLPPANLALDKIIADRTAAFDATKASATRGAEVFTKNCAVCHAVEGQGGAIGPQLDGIGGRGAARLCEDILDPNRNVDRAFRLTLITKKDGNVVSGLLRREEGAQVVLADLAGQEQRIATDDVQSKQETDTSLMTPIFGETIPPAEFNDLLAFLLSKRAAK